MIHLPNCNNNDLNKIDFWGRFILGLALNYNPPVCTVRIRKSVFTIMVPNEQ